MWGIVLNAAFVVAQAGVGLYTGSVALLSDAGHNLSDVASLLLSLLAYRLARRPPTHSFTYGYKKTTVLAALVNAVVLLIAIGVLGFEAVMRLQHPRPLDGGLVAIVAGVGIVVNLGSAMFFFRSKEHDLNTKGAYLHLLTDALVSVGVVIAGVAIKYTGLYWLDGAVSLVVLVVILVGTWGLLTDSLRMALDAVPHNVTPEEIKRLVLAVPGVEEMYHTHIWAMSTTQNALTTHLTLSDKLSFEEKMKLVHDIKHQLHHHNIHHATIELESPRVPCEDKDC
ncbi:cation diffusion facilitator family transporter [Nemorincola caseinilytica]|uniref:Cation diffusion facilitator family transporter n=1 Tax=Nemorincola caseinilytica TaxID=2054315 RepID=A0ABP8NJ59_9BACT